MCPGNSMGILERWTLTQKKLFSMSIELGCVYVPTLHVPIIKKRFFSFNRSSKNKNKIAVVVVVLEVEAAEVCVGFL